ncbi:hypothetical protein LDO31_18670 [Luteimonas sp. XNQY3]|nr:SbcC/MukB-like Walker B domain-containing protein [Luteimonas sp. XNQY3]MCD9008217.1 hypothetical protein [Luteimonas sp. XNQY3]
MPFRIEPLRPSFIAAEIMGSIGATTILTRRVLPGVDLELEDHTQTDRGQLVPLAWPEFREWASERTVAAGGKPDFPRDRLASDFVQRMLFQLRADRARSIDNVAFSKALKNALNLKDVHDASAFVRDRIIEERPINISEFRHQLETFRDLKQKIVDVIERIQIGGNVLEACQKTILARMRKVSYAALAAELHRDQAMEKLDDSLEAKVEAERGFATASQTLESTKQGHETAERRLKELTARAKNDPELQKHQALTTDRERLLTPLKKNLTTELRRIVGAFGTAKVRDPEANGWTFLAKPWESLLDRIANSAAIDSLRLDAATEAARLRDAHAGCQSLLEAIKKREASDATALEQAKLQLKTALQQLERVKTGRVQLPDAVINVRNLLEEQGIEATPVCDLVSVTDPSWAPAIEAYLRSNTYALLVEPGREDDAIRIYEAIPDGYNPFGVKIVQPRRQTHNPSSLPENALAHLITGQNEQAVNFLRSRLRHLLQLETATSRSDDGLTRKGTLVNNGTIERLRLPAAGEVLLGKQDMRAKLDHLARQKQRLDQQVQTADRKAQQSKELLQAIAPLTTLKDLIENIQRWLEEHSELERPLDDAQELARLQQNPDLVAMQELLDVATQQYNDARQAHHDALTALGSAKTAEDNAITHYDDLKASADRLAHRASEDMRQPFVDAGWIDERRTGWEREGKTLEDMINTCTEGVKRESTAYGTQESEMRTRLREYVNRYQFDTAANPSDPDEITGAMESELKRLQDSELAIYQQQADEAYHVAVSTFRSRIAANLRSSFDDMANQLRELNSIMARMPAFTNDERYHFKWWVNPEYKTLHRFISDIANRSSEDNLFEDPINTPDEFRALLEEVNGPSQELLRDYRKFFSFEVEVRNDGQTISTLKNRMEKGSGGEHRAPLFVVAGAALAAAYGKLQGDTSGMSLILFDELGDKIDGNNTKAVFEYLRSLGLQPIVAAPDDALGKINESVDGYIELYRDGAYLAVNHVGLGPDTRELLTSDSWERHPELLEAETRKIMAERGIPS